MGEGRSEMGDTYVQKWGTLKSSHQKGNQNVVMKMFKNVNGKILLRRKSFIRPHKAAAGRRLAPALHSKAGHRICSRSHEVCVLTWLACCDRPQDSSFVVTMGANGVLGLFIDIKVLTSNAHFKVD